VELAAFRYQAWFPFGGRMEIVRTACCWFWQVETQQNANSHNSKQHSFERGKKTSIVSDVHNAIQSCSKQRKIESTKKVETNFNSIERQM